MKLISIIIFSILLVLPSFAQEQEKDLVINAEIYKNRQLEKEYAPRASRGGGSLELPFTDDFSKYSFPTNNPDVPVEWQQWEETGAYLNENFPLFPPTIGVATFDGLKADGYPYDISVSNSYGQADTLISLPINLQGLSAGDNVYLTFYYQGGGRGNNPEAADSLIVDFYSPDDDAWFRKWATPGVSDGIFHRQFIQVIDPWFFRSEFRFRFRNYATLSGSLDHWHVDYVVLDENIDPNNFNLIDVAMIHPQTTLLSEYSAMPWTHFSDNPASNMSQTFNVLQGNLNDDSNIVSGYGVYYNGVEQYNQADLYLNTTGNGFSTFEATYPANTAPANYVYDSSVNDTCAFFDVSVYTNATPDGNRWNDTLHIRQEFTNFYAYDDGSAERAYSLENAAGGKLAVKFNAVIPDSLVGLFLYFTPFGIDVSSETFLLRAWGDNGGIPGDELAENFEFHSPTYYPGGPNVFGYYEFDNPIAVDGNFFVGWVQNSNAELNIGLDKNSVLAANTLFYQTGIGASWTASSITGAVMVRPVLKAGKSEVWNGIPENAFGDLQVYPNPASTQVSVVWDDPSLSLSAEIVDLSGRVLKLEPMSTQRIEVDLSDIPSGLYLLITRNKDGVMVHRKKIVKE